MTRIIQETLMPGVRLTAVPTQKFKTGMLGVQLLAPMEARCAPANAAVPMTLRRGTARHPDMMSLAAALDDLYGGSIEPMIRKKGETQCVGFTAVFLDDAFSLDGGKVLEPAAGLLGDLLLRPAGGGEAFRADYFGGERDNLVSRIQAQKNDKRQFSMARLVELMCKNEAYGVDRLGSEEAAAALTERALWTRYRALLAGAPVELFYCGAAPLSRVEDALCRALESLPAAGERAVPGCSVIARPEGDAPHVFVDRLDVTQGKLALGFRTGGVTAKSAEFPALMVFNALFGGTTTSKLFMNVRERLSLCYYASSLLEKYKGLMLVSSGIEMEQRGAARREILHQLDLCRAGDITAQELEAARRSAVNALRTTGDTQGRLEDYWLGQAAAGLTETPEELAARVETVTLPQVVEAAQRIRLDSEYFLTAASAEGGHTDE